MAATVSLEAHTKMLENRTQDGRFKCQFEKMEVLHFFSQLNQVFSFGIVVWDSKLLKHGKPRKTKIGQRKRLTPFLLESLQLVVILPIELSFLLCKFLSCEGCSLEFSLMGARFLEDGLVVLERYTAFSNNQKMVSILHKELERKVVKRKHMKLEVMQPKIKNKSELPARK